jgi:hypothetical protein
MQNVTWTQIFQQIIPTVTTLPTPAILRKATAAILNQIGKEILQPRPTSESAWKLFFLLPALLWKILPNSSPAAMDHLIIARTTEFINGNPFILQSHLDDLQSTNTTPQPSPPPQLTQQQKAKKAAIQARKGQLSNAMHTLTSNNKIADTNSPTIQQQLNDATPQSQIPQPINTQNIQPHPAFTQKQIKKQLNKLKSSSPGSEMTT